MTCAGRAAEGRHSWIRQIQGVCHQAGHQLKPRMHLLSEPINQLSGGPRKPPGPQDLRGRLRTHLRLHGRSPAHRWPFSSSPSVFTEMVTHNKRDLLTVCNWLL